MLFYQFLTLVFKNRCCVYMLTLIFIRTNVVWSILNIDFYKNWCCILTQIIIPFIGFILFLCSLSSPVLTKPFTRGSHHFHSQRFSSSPLSLAMVLSLTSVTCDDVSISSYVIWMLLLWQRGSLCLPSVIHNVFYFYLAHNSHY